MSLLLKYQERCQGCRRCVTEAPIDSNTANNSQKWWQLFIGRKEQPGDENRRKYAKVLNENCGKTVEVQLDAVDLLIRNLDEGVSY
jgi:Fe-S-cluster-containing dehydrogenase component